MNFIKNEKNVYHDVSNQFNVKNTSQNENNSMNKINFNDDAVKAANFVIVNFKSVSLRTCHKC